MKLNGITVDLSTVGLNVRGTSTCTLHVIAMTLTLLWRLQSKTAVKIILVRDYERQEYRYCSYSWKVKTAGMFENESEPSEILTLKNMRHFAYTFFANFVT